jgi:diadenosine tetraphosphate (Ap4A) HIT family hydrolase
MIGSAAPIDLNDPCQACQISQGTLRPYGLEPVMMGPFVVHPRSDPGAVAAWLVVAPRRHVLQIDDLSPSELAELGPTLGKVAAALRRESGCEKIYVNVFAEVLHHLHVHVIARMADTPPHLRGPGIFATLDHPAQSEAIVQVARGVLRELRQEEKP